MHCRLEDDERLDALVGALRKKTPLLDVSPQAEDQSSDVHSLKGELKGGLCQTRERLQGLEERLAAKRKALAAKR